MKKIPDTPKHEPETITILKQELPVTHKSIPQVNLRFYPDNPRIYSVVRAGGSEPTEEEIYERLIEQEHVRQLVHDIQKQGGLVERILVRGGTMHVLEGNSRLAAYRFLAKKDPIAWGKIKCTVLPANISDTAVFALLAQFHIKGKKDWAPYEQGGFLYRRFSVDKVEPEDLAKDIGLGPNVVKDMIATYQFMIDYNQTDVSRWSYYYEYIKSRKIKKARREFPELDEVVVRKIETGEIARAVDVRGQLPVICDAPRRVLKAFVEERSNFARAIKQAKDAGSDNTELKRIGKFRAWIVSPETEKMLFQADGRHLKTIVSDLTKISTRTAFILRRLKKKLT